MHSGEMLLVIGATVILGMLFLSVNTAINQNEIILMRSTLELTGMELSQDIIENALHLCFDEAVVDTSLSSLPGAFTSPGALGPETGEIYPNFDDVDDYNGYTDTISTPVLDYCVSVSVAYADSLQPDSVITSGQTFLKKMTVIISSPFLDNTIKNMFLYSFRE